MDDSPEVPDLGEYIEDVATLSGNPKKLIAKKTVNAYTKGAIAAVATATLGFGAVAAGPVPVIAHQQEPVKRPDEHIASQSQVDEATMEAANTLEDTLVSVAQPFVSDDLQVRARWEKARTLLQDTWQPPLPLITADELEKPKDTNKPL